MYSSLYSAFCITWLGIGVITVHKARQQHNVKSFNLLYFVFIFQSLPDRELTVGNDYHWLTFQVTITIANLTL